MRSDKKVVLLMAWPLAIVLVTAALGRLCCARSDYWGRRGGEVAEIIPGPEIALNVEGACCSWSLGNVLESGVAYEIAIVFEPIRAAYQSALRFDVRADQAKFTASKPAVFESRQWERGQFGLDLGVLSREDWQSPIVAITILAPDSNLKSGRIDARRLDIRPFSALRFKEVAWLLAGMMLVAVGMGVAAVMARKAMTKAAH